MPHFKLSTDQPAMKTGAMIIRTQIESQNEMGPRLKPSAIKVIYIEDMDRRCDKTHFVLEKETSFAARVTPKSYNSPYTDLLDCNCSYPSWLLGADFGTK